MKNIIFFFVPAFLLGVILKVSQYSLPPVLVNIFPELFAFIGLLLVFRAYAGRKNVFIGWILIIMNHFWVVLAISFNEALTLDEILFYLIGVVITGIIGYIVLLKLTSVEKDVDLNRFQGHSYEHPKLAAVFLVACIGLAGFPITSTFIGEDILFSHIGYNQVILAFILSLGFVVSGIALIRMYARIFLGPHVKRYHAIAQRSS